MIYPNNLLNMCSISVANCSKKKLKFVPEDITPVISSTAQEFCFKELTAKASPFSAQLSPGFLSNKKVAKPINLALGDSLWSCVYRNKFFSNSWMICWFLCYIVTLSWSNWQCSHDSLNWALLAYARDVSIWFTLTQTWPHRWKNERLITVWMAKKKSGIPPNFHSTFFVPQKKCPLTISDFHQWHTDGSPVFLIMAYFRIRL